MPPPPPPPLHAPLVRSTTIVDGHKGTAVVPVDLVWRRRGVGWDREEK